MSDTFTWTSDQTQAFVTAVDYIYKIDPDAERYHGTLEYMRDVAKKRRASKIVQLCDDAIAEIYNDKYGEAREDFFWEIYLNGIQTGNRMTK